jgi:beta-glucosidase
VVALEDTSPIPAESLRPPSGEGRGLQGEYFKNVGLTGEPAVRRVDAKVDFHWATNAPMDGFPTDGFSARWTGRLVAPAAGRYAISLSSNDGGRLFLDDKPAVDLWADHATLTAATVVELKAGEERRVRIDYYEKQGHAEVVLGWRKLEDDLLNAAVAAAAKADAVVVFAGLSEALETEALDRPDLRLPAGQDELIAAVAKANRNLAVVLNSGGPLLMDPWLPSVPAVLEAFYLGQEGGQALAEVLFGDVSPSGKLPASFIKRWEDSSAYGRYPGSGTVSYDEGVFVGYRHLDAKGIEPLFAFGHGLSYAPFELANLTVTPARPGPQEPVGWRST